MLTRSQLKDRVIVDNDGNIQMLESWKDELNMQEMFEPMMASMQMFSQKEHPIKPGDFDESNVDLDSFEPTKDFSDLQALLCPASLTCFSLAMRKWYTISIDNLSEIAWNKSAWDHLVLDQMTKLTIRTLVANHRVRSRTSDKDIMTGDVIERKGSVCHRSLSPSMIGFVGVLTGSGISDRTLWSSRSREDSHCRRAFFRARRFHWLLMSRRKRGRVHTAPTLRHKRW